VVRGETPRVAAAFDAGADAFSAKDDWENNLLLAAGDNQPDNAKGY
jgi:hypothetical protein